MASVPSTQLDQLSTLSDAEIDALISAASWYASYRQAEIREQWSDQSAAERTRRQKFLDLHHALRKMGVRRPHPQPATETIEI